MSHFTTLFATDEDTVQIQPWPMDLARIPLHYDPRGLPNAPQPARDQGTCGACWAFATVGMLEDRFFRAGVRERLSVLKPLLCDWNETQNTSLRSDNFFNRDAVLTGIANFTCFGNTVLSCCRYLYVFGTTTDRCVPYTLPAAAAADHPPFCQSIVSPFEDMCSDFGMLGDGSVIGTPARAYRASCIYALPPSVPHIQTELLDRGTVVATLRILDDYDTFDPLKETYPTGRGRVDRGGHAVAVIGWRHGAWLVRNSSGTQWGDQGCFWVAWGKSTIEQTCIAVQPDLWHRYGLDTLPSPLRYVLPTSPSRQLVWDIKYARGSSVADILPVPETGYSYRTSRSAWYAIPKTAG